MPLEGAWEWLNQHLRAQRANQIDSLLLPGQVDFVAGHFNLGPDRYVRGAAPNIDTVGGGDLRLGDRRHGAWP